MTTQSAENDARARCASSHDGHPCGVCDPAEKDVHGPHVECGNMGCRRRGLSGMHCRDNDECDGGPHEDCPVLARVTPPEVDRPDV